MPQRPPSTRRDQAIHGLGGWHDLLLMALLMATVSSADSEWLDLHVALEGLPFAPATPSPTAYAEPRQLPVIRRSYERTPKSVLTFLKT
jgi:hypothetical protein